MLKFKWGFVLLTVLLLFGLLISCSWAEPLLGEADGVISFTVGSLDFTVNGENYLLDAAPYIKDGRTFIEIRHPAAALQIPEECLIWDNTEKSMTGTWEENSIKMTIGSKICWVNEVPYLMDVSPEIVNGRVMVPLRWAAEAMGAKVEWKDNVVTLTY
ncbi:MAG: copper amine oxidase N-terminal domain-containing protein [Clostridia bacterium]|nr:copper amine oxidase N-terminal domain-containing protein [Clostridia bacterium]